MTLDPPLAHLVAHCETICVHGCCGLDAYDFSPVHIASYLTRTTRGVDEAVTAICDQLEALRANYGSSGASGRGVTVESLNEVFTGQRLDQFVAELLGNIPVALALIEQSERLRYRKQEPIASSEP